MLQCHHVKTLKHWKLDEITFYWDSLIKKKKFQFRWAGFQLYGPWAVVSSTPLILKKVNHFLFSSSRHSINRFTLRTPIWASCWQQCRQSGCSVARLNSPSRSQELHSRLLEKPRSLHASDDSSAPNADSWRERKEKHDPVVETFLFKAWKNEIFCSKNVLGFSVINWL